MVYLRENKHYLIFIVISAVVIYIIQSLAWPLSCGRDFNSYVNTFLELSSSERTFQALPLFRPPLTPIYICSLYLAGGTQLLEVVQCLLFCLSILATYYIGSFFNRYTALISAFFLILYPEYGAIFHELSSNTDCQVYPL